MQYSFTCPAQGCSFSVKVNTQNNEWALEKIMEVSFFHNKQYHPNLPSITHKQIRNIVLSEVKER